MLARSGAEVGIIHVAGLLDRGRIDGHVVEAHLGIDGGNDTRSSPSCRVTTSSLPATIGELDLTNREREDFRSTATPALQPEGLAETQVR